MNEEFELRNRIASADPAKDAESLNEGVVARAALGKAPKVSSFRVARLTMAAASLSILGLAVTSISLPGQNQGPLFELASGGPQGATTMAGAESAATDGKMAADSAMIWPGFSYNHIAGDISNETGRGKVYQAELVGDPNAIVRKIAEFFGIEGEPKRDEWASDEYPSYSIQGENYSAGIYFSGTGSWYFSNWDSMAYGCATDSSEDGEASSREYCEPKPTPELIPAEADLIAQATDVFDRLGFDVDADAATVWRSEWGASVTFPNVQSGINTGMDFYAGWDSKGDLNYVSGHSFKLVDRGEFDTIGAKDAVARIADGRWYGSAPSSYYQDMAVAYETAISAPEARDNSTEMSVEAAPADEGEKVEVIESEPTEYPEPVVQDLLISKAEAVTLSVFDGKGNLWFVPGYLLYNDQGWFDSIISLEEGVIALPEPYDYGIMPVEEPQG